MTAQIDIMHDIQKALEPVLVELDKINQKMERLHSPVEKELVSIDELKTMLNASNTKIYNLIKSGEIEKPKKIGRNNYWTSSYIRKWLEAR